MFGLHVMVEAFLCEGEGNFVNLFEIYLNGYGKIKCNLKELEKLGDTRQCYFNEPWMLPKNFLSQLNLRLNNFQGNLEVSRQQEDYPGIFIKNN